MPRRNAAASAGDYETSVFVNCPFDDEYRPPFDAIVFTVFRCGLKPRCSLETADGGAVRIDKIARIIAECRWAVHDISRTELNRSGLPRFNMPFELGLFLGAGRFGDDTQQQKNCLILDREPHRYQAFLSDIAGQDIAAHGALPETAIRAVRDWLATSHLALPGPDAIATSYQRFQRALPLICTAANLRAEEMTFVDRADAIHGFLGEAG